MGVTPFSDNMNKLEYESARILISMSRINVYELPKIGLEDVDRVLSITMVSV